MHKYISVWLLVVLLFAEASVAHEIAEARTPPVFESSVDRPYQVLGEIKDNLRKPFAFLPDPSKEKIFDEIWERGRKMGADAVINVRFGPTKRTLFNYGKTPIAGTAIKYVNAQK